MQGGCRFPVVRPILVLILGGVINTVKQTTVNHREESLCLAPPHSGGRGAPGHSPCHVAHVDTHFGLRRDAAAATAAPNGPDTAAEAPEVGGGPSMWPGGGCQMLAYVLNKLDGSGTMDLQGLYQKIRNCSETEMTAGSKTRVPSLSRQTRRAVDPGHMEILPCVARV